MLTREQRFADKIFGQVEEISKLGDQSKKDEYKSMTENFPVLVRTAGLAQALHFVESRNEKLVEHLSITLEIQGNDGKEKRKNLLEKSRRATLDEYIYLTEKVLTALQWYKRFSGSLLKKPKKLAEKKDDKT